MSRVRISHLFLIMTVVVSMAQTPASAISIYPKYTVHIMNNFSSNQNPLKMHCWSNDDDLGEHTLWMKNEFYFSFREKFFGWTHFWCEMHHGTQVKTFDVYSTRTRAFKCPSTFNCYWSVRDDGFYFSDDLEKWDKYIGWSRMI
ncbi:hypothetical protein ACOSP7_006321 [Xanthoceras sorbifolium]